MTKLYIDPGPERSAMVLTGRSTVISAAGHLPNQEALDWIGLPVHLVVMEDVVSHGSLFPEIKEQLLWIGAFRQEARVHHIEPVFINRGEVKARVMGSRRCRIAETGKKRFRDWKATEMQGTLIEHYGGTGAGRSSPALAPGGVLHGMPTACSRSAKNGAHDIWCALAAGWAWENP